MSVSINGTSGLVFNDASTQSTAATGFGFKNRIINGAMMIDQRNAGASVTLGSGSLFPVDRFYGYNNTSGATVTAQQSSTAPSGFTKSLLFTVSTGATTGAADYTQFRHTIEGYNTADLDYGLPTAKTVTVSFWVRSSVTGTYGFCIMNADGSRSYMASYTISSANTWTQAIVTIPGDTGGTWNTTNSGSLMLCWDLGVGSNRSISVTGAWQTSAYKDGLTGGVKLAATTGATFYITGVQLEKGSTATSFDYRPYGTELALCQRYYYKWLNDSGIASYPFALQSYSASAAYGKLFDLPVTMRATPTCSTSGTFYAMSASGGTQTAFTGKNITNSTKNTISTGDWTGASGMTVGQSQPTNANNGSYIEISAEL